MTLTQEFARFINGLCFEDLPEAVRLKVLDLVADWLANAAAGAESHMGRALYSLVSPCSGEAISLLAGSFKEVDPLSAALANAGACHSMEFDDTYRAGLFHPGAPVISAAWAASGTFSTSGRRFLTAVVAGYEISQRLAKVVNPEHYRFWHTTGTVGTFGAAAAAAHCLDLGPDKTAWALGLSGTQSAGLWEVLPQTPLAKNLHPAKAAHSGVLAALLAEHGIPGPDAILEGDRGFFAATVSKPVDFNACLEGLGRQWLILDTTMKAYPVCGHAMTPIEAALSLHNCIDTPAIKRVEVRVNPVSFQVAGIPYPLTSHQAKFSIPFCVSLALLKGKVTQDAFLPEELKHPELADLLSRVRLIPDEEMTGLPGQRPARVTVWLINGEILEEKATHRKGDPERPFSDQEKMEKFLKLAETIWGLEASHQIYRLITELPQADDMRKWWASLPRPNKRSDFKTQFSDH